MDLKSRSMTAARLDKSRQVSRPAWTVLGYDKIINPALTKPLNRSVVARIDTASNRSWGTEIQEGFLL